MLYIKKLLAVCAATMLLASCGDALPQDDVEAFLDEEPPAADTEYSTNVQALTAQATPTISYGITTALSKPNCNRTSTRQSCLVPVTKNVKWCVDTSPGAVSPADYVKVSNAMSLAISNAMTKTGFSFQHVADGVDCKTNLGSGNLNVRVTVTTTNNCGNAFGANIENYVCSTPTLGSSLSESLPGTYRQMLGGVINVDWNDCIHPAGDAGHGKVMYHGLGHNLLGLMGVGSQTSSSSLLSRRAALPVSDTLGMSSSENCRALGYDTSGTGSFGLHATLGCPN